MYYFILPVAYLPLWLLYGLASLLCPVVYYIARYRLKVVRANLGRCFPDKSTAELRRIERQYYRHLCDLLAEGIYNLRAPLHKVRQHYHLENAEILEPYYNANRSVVLMSAHYNNWEYMITSLDHSISHHGIGVGKPLDNKGFGRFITARRARYGTEIVDQTDVRQTMAYYDRWHIYDAQRPVAQQPAPQLLDHIPRTGHPLPFRCRAFCTQIQYARLHLRRAQGATWTLQRPFQPADRQPQQPAGRRNHTALRTTP